MTARWIVGARDVAPDDRVLALDLDQIRRAEAIGAIVVGVHDYGTPPRLSDVLVEIPRWRGHSFIPYLEWLVCAKLAAPDAQVRWRAEKRGGATGLRRILVARGWTFDEKKRKGIVEFTGEAPPAGDEPVPESFESVLGNKTLRFASDWGVFSEGEIDEGTQLLLGVALEGPHRDVVLDIGTGYGPLAIGLVACERSRRAIATEIDAVSLLLAKRNAADANVDLEVHLLDNAERLKADLVVCNIPTHATTENSDVLIRVLAHHARHAETLVVVHGSLEERYAKRFAEQSIGARTEAQETHTVLRLRPV